MPTAPQQPALAATRERLVVPIAWWLIALFFLISVLAAVGFYRGPLIGVVVTVLAATVVGAVLLRYGATTVTVDDEALTVGPHRIEWRWVGGAVALDRVRTRHRLGPGADARAHLITRPYLPETVEITLADAADPHPYWLVASRQATTLAAAINARVGAAPTEDRSDA